MLKVRNVHRCRYWCGVVALFALLVLAGCAGLDPSRIPAIDGGSDGERLPGKIVWHDLLSEDPAAARRFYGGLFGWTFDDVDVGGGKTYTVVRHRGRAIAGLVDGRGSNPDVNVSRWIPVLSVTDLDQSVAYARANEAPVFQSPVFLAQRGRMAVIGDPEEAVLTLLQSNTGDPPDREAGAGDFLWNELWSTDPASAVDFYTGLVPAFDVKLLEGDAGPYRILKSGGLPRAGVLASPVPQMPATWMAYIKVEDVGAVAAEAEALGGRVLLQPRENPRGGEVAILSDPAGAGFLIQTWDGGQGTP
ncbi:MAG: VOC family protein [Thiohalocapsa sp.]|nr:VOC family protein [Thiohalocapsa sp.]MCF7991498.1 VOC family protein [Thiohalocapsa sp.]